MPLLNELRDFIKSGLGSSSGTTAQNQTNTLLAEILEELHVNKEEDTMGEIRDPLTGDAMRVTEDGRGEVRADVALENASGKKLAFLWHSVPYDPAAADTILAVKNTSSTRLLNLTDLWINNGATASEYQVHILTASYTSAGTAVTGVNLNPSSSKAAEATAHADETGNTQGTRIHTTYLPVDATRHIDLRGWSLGQNVAIAVDIVADGGGEQSVSIVGYYGDSNG